MKIFTFVRMSFLSIFLLSFTSCGNEKKSHETEHINQEAANSFENQIYKDSTEISAQDWEEINLDLAPQIGVQMGMNFFSLSRNIDINSVSSKTPRSKPTTDSGPNAPSFTSKSYLKSELKYFQNNYVNLSFWNFLKDKNFCQQYAIELIGQENPDFEKLNQQYYVINEKDQTVRMTIPNYLRIRAEVEWLYSASGRFLDSVTAEFEYYSTYARSYDIRGLYWLENSSIKTSQLYENWLNGEDPQGEIEKALYLMCRQFLADPDPETAFDCREKITNKTLGVSEFITILQFSRTMRSSMFYISSKRHLPKSEYQVQALDSKTQITIFAQRPTDPQFAAFFKESIEKYWKTDKYQINLAWAEENDHETRINIQFSNEGTNRANNSTGTIFLNVFRFRYDELMGTIIAHEFGHLLGFKDCYVEFYDDDNKSMVDYVTDVNNIMCTNAGWVQDQHFEEFLRAQE